MAFSKLELIAAVESDDLEKVRAFCSMKDNEGPRQDDIDEALRVAAKFGRLEVVKYLSGSTTCSRCAVSAALIIFCNLNRVDSIKKIELIEFISAFNSQNKPSKESLYIAWQGVNRTNSQEIETNDKLKSRASHFPTAKTTYSYANDYSRYRSFAKKESQDSKKSCFTPNQLKDIEKRITQLEAALKDKGCWSYFFSSETSRAIKRNKKEGLDELIILSYQKGMTISYAIEVVDARYKDLRAGWFSETDILLDDLLNTKNQNGCFCW
ncbi:MAG: hypothetical protein H0U73_01440 [Tatlockia sp.]|nr:hypothetical protein [Tatlockia sp.]